MILITIIKGNDILNDEIENVNIKIKKYYKELKNVAISFLNDRKYILIYLLGVCDRSSKSLYYQKIKIIDCDKAKKDSKIDPLIMALEKVIEILKNNE